MLHKKRVLFPIFNIPYLIVLSSREEILALFKKNNIGLELDEDCDGAIIHPSSEYSEQRYKDKFGSKYVLWVETSEIGQLDESIIVHEALHLLTLILESRETPINEDTNEIAAYGIQGIYKEVLAFRDSKFKFVTFKDFANALNKNDQHREDLLTLLSNYGDDKIDYAEFNIAVGFVKHLQKNKPK